jgi:methyltransferase (TIGR00027 family)
MAELKQVTGTAFIVAEFRADESNEAEPLYRDEIVPLFLDAGTRKAAEDFSAGFPPVKELVKIRTRYLDDRLEAQLRQGFSQVVILGAGFDTRAVRKQTPGVTFFEIDDPALLKLKKERLEANHIDAAAKLIPGNYVSDDLTGMLESSGFDAALPTHFIWEGNTMYLSAGAVHHVMQTIEKHVRQFTLAFDYMAPEVIAKTTGDPAITKVVERFAAMGAPWIFGIGNLAEFAAREGMAVVEDHKTASLYRAYRPGGTLDSPLFSYYSLCTVAPARCLTR